MPANEGRTPLAADAAKLWLASLAEQALAFVRGVILPRYLGPGLYGILGSLGMITKYGSYLQLGLTAAVNREVPYALGAGDKNRADRIARAVFSFNLFTSVVPAVGVVLFAVATWGRYRSLISWGLLVFAVLLVTSRFENYFGALFRARRQFNAAAAFALAKATTAFAAVVVPVYFFRLAGVYVGLVVTGLLFLGVGALWTRTWASPWPDWRLVRELLPVGLPLAALGALGFLLQSADRLLVIKFFELPDVGQYMLAVTVATFIYFFPMNVSQAMAPRIYGLRRDGDRTAFQEYLMKPSLLLTYVVATAGGLAVLCLIPFVRYVLPNYGAAVPIVAVLLIGITCQGGAQGAGHILIALSRFKTIAVVQIASLAVTLAVGVAVLRWGGGLVGVAAASSAGLVAYACALQYFAWREMALPSSTAINAFGFLLVPPTVLAGASFISFYAGGQLGREVGARTGTLAGDLLVLAIRLVVFVVAAAACGYYVERNVGVGRAALRRIKEVLSAVRR